MFASATQGGDNNPVYKPKQKDLGKTAWIIN